MKVAYRGSFPLIDSRKSLPPWQIEDLVRLRGAAVKMHKFCYRQMLEMLAIWIVWGSKKAEEFREDW